MKIRTARATTWDSHGAAAWAATPRRDRVAAAVARSPRSSRTRDAASTALAVPTTSVSLDGNRMKAAFAGQSQARQRSGRERPLAAWPRRLRVLSAMRPPSPRGETAGVMWRGLPAQSPGPTGSASRYRTSDDEKDAAGTVAQSVTRAPRRRCPEVDVADIDVTQSTRSLLGRPARGVLPEAERSSEGKSLGTPVRPWGCRESPGGPETHGSWAGRCA